MQYIFELLSLIASFITNNSEHIDRKMAEQAQPVLPN